MAKSPVRPIKQIIVSPDDPGYVNRIMVATPTLGTIRMEWAAARFNQIVPMNWSMVQYTHFMNSFIPLGFQLADAQNVIVKEVLTKDFEWLLLLEDDTMPPPDLYIRLNDYMRKGDVPIVSGLYFSRSEPSEPLVFRGRGNGAYRNFKPGDLVWADGVPTGCLLIHHSILKALWEESPEYSAGGMITRRIFEMPVKTWLNEETGEFNTLGGTSDLEWCTRIMKDRIFEKAGWPAYQQKKYPFLIDTNIFCTHIDRQTGQQFP